MGRKLKRRKKLCECGCGEAVKWGMQNKSWNRFILSHVNRGRSPWNKGGKGLQIGPTKGMKHSVETRKKMSEVAKRRTYSLETRKKISESLKGRKFSDETRRKISESKMGKSGPKWTDEHKRWFSERMTGENHPLFGIGHTEETKRIISEKAKKRYEDPRNNPNWQGGKSFEKYCEVWKDQDYRQDLLERDNYECQNPDCWGTSERLTRHHINYKKKDCSPKNLIILCNSCNVRAGKRKRRWKLLYQRLIRRTYAKQKN